MKKIVSLLAAGFIVTFSSYTQCTDILTTGVQNVAAVKKMSSDQSASLVGRITKQIRHDRYLFMDSSGKIEIEIEDGVLHGRIISPDTKVRIQGEIERDDESITIVVERLEIMGTD